MALTYQYYFGSSIRTKRDLIMNWPGLHSELRILLSTKTLKHPRKAVNHASLFLKGNWIGLMIPAYLPMVLVLHTK